MSDDLKKDFVNVDKNQNKQSEGQKLGFKEPKHVSQYLVSNSQREKKKEAIKRIQKNVKTFKDKP